ncbi:hypothetical protein T06_15276 [Trichinella sp. T6]|nr:hypothetical protein T06_15276 [Trichinella sp. T6]
MLYFVKIINLKGLSTTRGVPLEKCNVQILLGSRTLPGGYKSWRQYLGKYAFMKRAISFWKVPRQTNRYVSNKWPLKLPCAYLNTQGSSPSETLLIPIEDS